MQCTNQSQLNTILRTKTQSLTEDPLTSVDKQRNTSFFLTSSVLNPSECEWPTAEQQTSLNWSINDVFYIYIDERQGPSQLMEVKITVMLLHRINNTVIVDSLQ